MVGNLLLTFLRRINFFITVHSVFSCRHKFTQHLTPENGHCGHEIILFHVRCMSRM